MRTFLGMAALLLAAGTAGAADRASEAPLGADTRNWVELQASGRASLGAIRPMPGEVAEKVYERYLESFENRIPERYERERFVSSGSGGS
jgi:hypothetical protein